MRKPSSYDTEQDMNWDKIDEEDITTPRRYLDLQKYFLLFIEELKILGINLEKN